MNDRHEELQPLRWTEIAGRQPEEKLPFLRYFQEAGAGEEDTPAPAVDRPPR